MPGRLTDERLAEIERELDEMHLPDGYAHRMGTDLLAELASLRADLAAERAKLDIGAPMLTREQLGKIVWDIWDARYTECEDLWRDIGDAVARAVRGQWEFNAIQLSKQLAAERAKREKADRERDAAVKVLRRLELVKCDGSLATATYCPACNTFTEAGDPVQHEPDCFLAAEIRSAAGLEGTGDAE